MLPPPYKSNLWALPNTFRHRNTGLSFKCLQWIKTKKSNELWQPYNPSLIADPCSMSVVRYTAPSVLPCGLSCLVLRMQAVRFGRCAASWKGPGRRAVFWTWAFKCCHDACSSHWTGKNCVLASWSPLECHLAHSFCSTVWFQGEPVNSTRPF